MTFCRVAAAILMFKLLEVCWNWGFIVAHDGKVAQTIAVMTLIWLTLSVIIWTLLRELERAVKHHIGRRPPGEEWRARNGR